jgi:hypothetical protein
MKYSGSSSRSALSNNARLDERSQRHTTLQFEIAKYPFVGLPDVEKWSIVYAKV